LQMLARRDYDRQQSTTRRQLIRGAAIAGAGAISLTAATGTAAAQPSGTIPVSTDPAFIKFRGDRLRLVERSNAPSAPSSGRVLLYTDSGDL